MTRINLVPPEELMDQHLIAEYREILMVPGSLKRTIKSKNGLDVTKIPLNFTLNKGHVTFFYDKLLYLQKRYDSVIKEMRNRGFRPNTRRVFPTSFPEHLYNDWEPTANDFQIIRQRINEKIELKPEWYRKTKKVLNENI